MSKIKSNVKLKTLIAKLYYLLILCFALPTGTLFNIPIKFLIVGLLLMCLVFYDSLKLNSISWILAFVILLLIFWSVIAIFNGYGESTFNCLKSFLSLVLTLWISIILYCSHIIGFQKCIKYLSVSSILLLFGKIFFEFYFMALDTNVEVEIEILTKLFATQPMTAHFYLGTIKLHRIWYTNDAFVYVYFLYYLISSKRFYKKLGLIFFVAFFTLITYSRMYMIQFALCLSIAFLLDVFYGKNGTRKIALCVLIGVITIMLVILAKNTGSFGEQIFDLLNERFSGNTAEYSDEIRTVQFEYILSAIMERPLLGWGTGAYLKNYIRSQISLYGYELEYLSFFMQFGIIGFILIIGSLLFVVFKMCMAGKMFKKLYWFSLFSIVFWAIKPIYNPTFLSSASAAVLIAIAFYGGGLNRVCLTSCRVNMSKPKNKNVMV